MSALFWYKLLFMTEIIIAEILFTAKKKKRSHFVLRVALSIAVCYIVAVVFPEPKDVTYTWQYSSLMFLSLFAVTLLSLVFVYELSFSAALFYALTSYTLQHCLYEVFTVVVNAFSLTGGVDMYAPDILDFSSFNKGTLLVCLIYIDIYVVGYVAMFLSFGKRLAGGEELKLKSNTMLLFGAFILLVDIILNAVIVYDAEADRTYNLVVSIYNIMCCVLVFYIQINLISEKDLQIEMTRSAEMLRQAERQYALQKKNIDLINVKCHDLKRRMTKIAEAGRIDAEELDEITEAISVYDASVKTGNEVLDIILTEKSLLCRERKIKITCLADGAPLAFMKKGDIYALFVNILDNAIEAVLKLDDGEKRCISLNVTKSGGFVSIAESNYYSGDISFDERGLPLTDKTDKENHGFGMTSISSVVEKYGGDVTIEAKNGLFKLDVLLPMPKTDIQEQKK